MGCPIRAESSSALRTLQKELRRDAAAASFGDAEVGNAHLVDVDGVVNMDVLPETPLYLRSNLGSNHADVPLGMH